MDLSTLRLVSPPRIDSAWTRQDKLGALRVRLSIGRNTYREDPGLYKLGNPGKDAEVMVSSNYKLSFDVLRKNLDGMDAWILVLETYGINVWCAAGKGTFGTEELIRQIRQSQLHLFVDHKRVIVPQLGAPGISGYKVRDATGFLVKFGPVRSEDIKAYVAAGLKKNQDMRAVRFTLRDRMILAPVELVNSLKYLLYSIGIILIISGITKDGYSLQAMWKEGLAGMLYVLLAYVSGAFLAPVFLPWLPFRHFGGKGLVLGWITFGIAVLFTLQRHTPFHFLGWGLIAGAVSSFLTMNFTGASTYTSLSGVRKEMKLFVPLQLVCAGIGLSLVILSKF